MRFETKLPKDYVEEIWDMHPFNERGTITKRVRFGLENALYLYSMLSRDYAKRTDNNPDNFLIESVSVVGSGARANRIDSDLDLLLLAPKIDPVSADNIKLSMSYVLFCDRDIREGVDVFIRPSDLYPERGAIDITHYVRNLLDKYNSKLLQ